MQAMSQHKYEPKQIATMVPEGKEEQLKNFRLKQGNRVSVRNEWASGSI